MRAIHRLALAVALIVAPLAPAAVAQETPYLDDRSTPAALIRSLYNAIERREYARAWSYFDEPPAASFAAYVQGFADTRQVAIRTGAVLEEGAAGSVFYEVPVILESTAGDGTVTTFSGCYVVRQVNPAIQEPPFRPLLIESGRFAVSDIADFPLDCGGGAAEPAADRTARVMEIFAAAYGDVCVSLDPDFNPDGVTPEVYELRFRYDGDDIDRLFRLYRVWCSRGAYSEGHVYFLENDYGEVRPVAFAYPDLAITYRDGDSAKLESMAVAGFIAEGELPLSDFNPETMTIRDLARWRGLGDAAASGTWVFDQGAFRLDHFEVDPTFDGEVDPIVVVEDGRVVY